MSDAGAGGRGARRDAPVGPAKITANGSTEIFVVSDEFFYELPPGKVRGQEDDVRRIYRIASGLAASATVAALVTAVGAGVTFGW